jgi:hypothetical protein
MLSKESNDLITLTSPGTPGGDLLRRYWQPVALAVELTADVPLAVRVMSERTSSSSATSAASLALSGGAARIVASIFPMAAWKMAACAASITAG